MKKRRAQPGCGPELPWDAEEGDPDGRARRVTIEPDVASEGYVILDAARRKVFGGRVFRSDLEAEVYLQEANRRSHWMRWHLKLAQRRRRRSERRGKAGQLDLF